MRGQRLRRLAGAGAAFVIAVGLMSACGADGDGVAETTVPGLPTTEVDAAPTSVQAESTTTTTEVVLSPTTSSTTPSVTVAQPTIPTGSIPDDDEATACAAIQARLMEYRDLAESAGPDGLLTLQLGIEEFEHQIDFISQQQDWGMQMVEQLSHVRREWSTAYSEHASGNTAVAQEHFAAAFEHMDEALAVPCP